MAHIKLDKEDLYLKANGEDLVFEYQGKKVAEVLDNGNIKYFEKLPRGYKTEMQGFINGILNGTRVVI